MFHRDLKLENLLLIDPAEDRVKVTDFGLSKDTNFMSLARTKVGTITYMAPEVTLAAGGHDADASYDGKLSDVWSLGVILYVLIACNYPFGFGVCCLDCFLHAVCRTVSAAFNAAGVVASRWAGWR